MRDWAGAETFREVRAARSRLGGRVTLHRHGVEHYRRMVRVRGSA